MRVFRYQLEVTDHQVLSLPLSAQLLSVAPGRPPRSGLLVPVDAEHIDVWVLVPEQAPEVPYHLWIVGTGHPVPPELTAAQSISVCAEMFLGTAVMPSGLVWHVFVGAPGR